MRLWYVFLAVTVLFVSALIGNSDVRAAGVISNDQVQGAFDFFKKVGEADNAGSSVSGAAFEESCRVMSGLGQARLRQWIDRNKGYLSVGRLDLSRMCRSLSQHDNGRAEITVHLKETAVQAITDEALAMAWNSGLPYLQQLELEGSLLGDDASYSVTSVQPLWSSSANDEFLFNQVSWYREGTGTDDGDADNTLNFGLAYRRLVDQERLLVGANVFFDHQFDQSHNRLGVGVEAQSSLYGVSLNHYRALSGWKRIDALYEARALNGWDVELSGRVEELPSWTLYARGFMWDQYDNKSNIYGYDTDVEWSPWEALVVSVGMRDENHVDPEVKASMRLNWDFTRPLGEQFDRRLGMESVSDRIWDKVRRANTIRTQKRKRAEVGLVVVESTGSNSVVSDEGTLSLNVGMSFSMPATVRVANTVGAIVRVLLHDGGILTLAQNTQVRIEPGLLTLIQGSAQYVSGATNVAVNVPGGMIALLGTDIDIVTDGTDSSVRVRDGAVRFIGAVSGTAVLSGTVGRAVGGVVAAVIDGSAPHISHVAQVQQQIDWVASSQSGGKIAPYVALAPYVAVEDLVPGNTLQLGLQFNDVVTVSGGVPDLTIDIGGNSRTAAYLSGSGTGELVFGYVVQAGDAGATNVEVTGYEANGAAVSGNGKFFVSDLASRVINFSGAVADVTAPVGYAVVFTTDPIDGANENAAAFRITGAEVGTTYNYTITSSGGAGSVVNSGAIATATQNITGIDVSGLPDGTLTVSLTLTDVAANVGGAVTDTVVKNLVPVMNLVTHVSDMANLGVYTFAGTSIGAAAADRLVIVSVLSSGTSSEITSITLDGTPMTIHAQGNASSGWQNAAIASLAVPAGTTANFVVTQNTSGYLSQLFVYSATGLSSMVPTGADSDSQSDSLLLSVPVSQNGFVIGAAHCEASTSTPGIQTSGNALAVTDGAAPDDFNHYYAGHSEGLAANPNYPVTFNLGGGRPWMGAALVSWR